MASKNSTYGAAGGVLAFLGSLVYLYVLFTWYGAAGSGFGGWLSSASFLGPFVVGVALVSAITLFFMSLGTMAGRTGKDMGNTLWKFVVIAGVVYTILGGMSDFYIVLVGFLLTYIGTMIALM